jgi:hypothetical protein
VTVGRILERAREHRGAPEEILGEECPACGRPNGLIPIDDRDEGLPRSATRWACGCGYFVDRPLA